MKVILSTNQTNINSHRHISDIKMLHDSVLESECTDLICDNFLSTFSYAETEQVIQIIASKMRINSELTIQEIDTRLFCKKFNVEELDLENINALIFSTKRKSILTADKIISAMDKRMKLTDMHYSDQSCGVTMKYRRAI